jgi:hypothetical protein
MSWLWFLVIGGIAGWLAGKLTRGSGFGLLGDVIIGVVGALLGGISLWAGGPCFLRHSRLTRNCNSWSHRLPLSREIIKEDLTILRPRHLHPVAVSSHFSAIDAEAVLLGMYFL